VKIRQIIWPKDRTDHIAHHNVTPEEFEGKNPVYYVYGQTTANRYLLCIVIHFPDGNGYPITAREMNTSEKRRFRKRKR